MTELALLPRLCLRCRPCACIQKSARASAAPRRLAQHVSTYPGSRSFTNSRVRQNVEEEAAKRLPQMPTTPAVQPGSRAQQHIFEAVDSSKSGTPDLVDFKPHTTTKQEGAPKDISKMTPEEIRTSAAFPRRPRALQSIFLRPLKRKAEYQVPVCDLQLRSYSVRNLEFFADFALRAAYYLGLPASGPVPLPRIVNRYTVPKSHFIFKKSQENFERITYRRLIQIQDGYTDIAETWLAFLSKHQYHGVGMKANVWQFEKLGVSQRMDADSEEVKQSLGPDWAQFGRRMTKETVQKAAELVKDPKFQEIPTELKH